MEVLAGKYGFSDRSSSSKAFKGSVKPGSNEYILEIHKNR